MFGPEIVRGSAKPEAQVLASGAPLHFEERVEAAGGPRHYHTVKFPVRDAAGAIVAIGGISIDVTERKRAEEAARAAEARSRELLEASPDGIAVVRDLTVAYVNQAFCTLLGYDRPEDLIGKCGTDLLADAYKEGVTSNARDRARGLPVPSCYEVEYLHRDGRPVPAEIHVRRIDFDSMSSSLVYVRDITERKKAENALRESEARLQRFFEATFEGIVLHENGVILDANQAAADLCRCTVAYMKGRSVLEFTPPTSRDAVRDRIAKGDERPYEGIGLRRRDHVSGRDSGQELHGQRPDGAGDRLAQPDGSASGPSSSYRTTPNACKRCPAGCWRCRRRSAPDYPRSCTTRSGSC